MATTLRVVRAGHGPRVVLVHGSAADHATWSGYLAGRGEPARLHLGLASPLRDRFELVAYDRPADRATVADHAADVASLCDAPAIICGSSFGAVVALELARTRPQQCRGIVLIEPPMPASDEPVEIVGDIPGPAAFLAEFDRCVIEHGGPAAGELFLRKVLGDAAFDRIPRAFQERASAKWAEIRADSVALIAYAPRYRELASMTVPALLLGGERSAPYYRATLDALAATLPAARLEIVPNAGHMLHADAPRRFAELVVGFAETLVIE